MLEEAASEDAALVLAGETPEAAVTRIEAEVVKAETDATEAEAGAVAAAGDRAARQRADAATAALALQRERLTRVRRHESKMKSRNHRRVRR